MRLTIFGASGTTGRHVVQQAVASGHHVTAVVRNPEVLKHEEHQTGQVEVVVADVMRPAAITPHIEHADAVVSTLGTRGNPMRATTVCSDAIDSIIEAMQTTGVRRLLAMSAADFGNAPADGVLMRYVARPLVLGFLHGSLRDLRLMEGKLVASGLDWTVVRAPQLLNRQRDEYRASVGHRLPRAWFARRADVADFLVQNLQNSATFRQFAAVAR